MHGAHMGSILGGRWSGNYYPRLPLSQKKKKKLVFLFPGFFILWSQLLKWVSNLTAAPLFLQICCYWISYLGCYCLCDSPVSYVPLRKKKFQGQICRTYPVVPILVSGMLTVTQIKYLLCASHCFMWRIQGLKKKSYCSYVNVGEILSK